MTLPLCKYCNRRIFGVIWQEKGYCAECHTRNKPRLVELEKANAELYQLLQAAVDLLNDDHLSDLVLKGKADHPVMLGTEDMTGYIVGLQVAAFLDRVEKSCLKLGYKESEQEKE